MKHTWAAVAGLALVTVSSSAFAQMPSSSARQMPLWTEDVYLRADIGGAFAEDTTFKDTNPNASDPVLGSDTVPSSLNDSVIFGGGIGYRFTPGFRMDFTLDYLPTLDASGNVSPSPLPPLNFPLSASLDSLVGLVNAYLDIDGLIAPQSLTRPDNFGRWNPYITVGVGFARNDIGTASGNVGAVHYSVSGNTYLDLAWAAGAGVGYYVNPNVMLDLGYKYIDLGQVRTGTTGTASAGAFFTSGQVTEAKANLHVHTVLLGLRYNF